MKPPPLSHIDRTALSLLGDDPLVVYDTKFQSQAPAKLIAFEACIVCGFVHRLGDVKQKKPHYHWGPPSGGPFTYPLGSSGFSIERTICVACLYTDGIIRWDTFTKAREEAPDQHRTPGSFNAALPSFLEPQTLSSTRLEELFQKLQLTAPYILATL